MRLFAFLLAAALSTAPALSQEPYWQCARFAREFSGIEIRGDAWTWWELAEGRYARGYIPRVGAVMAFTPSGNMRLGHVATVTAVESAREITVTHANWSPIGGVRGQIERDVRVRDVSENNDWSRVRVWFDPIGDLGTTAWPVTGFIYPQRAFAAPRMAAATREAPRLRYASLDRLDVAVPKPRLIGNDVMRMAMLESATPRRPYD